MIDKVFQLPAGPLGTPSAIGSLYAVAAPLLGGFSFTLVALMMDMAGNTAAPENISPRFLLPAIGVFAFAGIVFIGTVQAGMRAQQNFATPSEYRDWYGIETGETLRDQAYQEQQRRQSDFETWASWTRFLYNLGVVAFLSGVTLLTVPVSFDTPSRWLLVAVPMFGLLAELIWIGVAGSRSFAKRRAATKAGNKLDKSGQKPDRHEGSGEADSVK